MTTLNESWAVSAQAGLDATYTWVFPASRDGGVTNRWDVNGAQAAYISATALSGVNPAIPTVALATDDYEVTATLAAGSAYATVFGCGCLARKATTGTASTDCNYYYFMFFRWDGDTTGQRSKWVLGKVVNNTFTDLATAYLANGTMPSGTLTFRVAGSTLTGFNSGSQVIQVTDTTFATGKYGGVIGARWTSGDAFAFESWGAADYTPIPPSAVTYYVKTGGNDSADGLSDGTAWATTTKVNATTLNPGDIVQFRGGDTFTGDPLVLTVSGADGGGDPDWPVIVRSYGTGKATLNLDAGSNALEAVCSGLEIRSLIFQSADVLGTETNYSGALWLHNTNTSAGLSHIYVDACEFHDYSYSGCYVSGNETTGAGIDDIRITNCLAEGNQGLGIAVGNTYAFNHSTTGTMTNVLIQDCVSHNNPGTTGGNPMANLLGNGFLLDGCNGGTIERCTAYANGTDCSGSVGGASGILLRACSGTTVQFNECYTTGGASIDGCGIDCDLQCSGCVVQYNYTHDNRAEGLFGYESVGNVYRYNISEDDGRNAPEAGNSAIRFANGSGDVYGNTVWISTATGGAPIGIYHTGAGGPRVFNNVIITSGSDAKVLSLAAGTVNGNAYWQIGDTTTFRATWGATTYTSLAAFRTGSSQETGTGFNVDPLLVDPGNGGTAGDPANLPALLTAYKLQGGSPIAAQGLNLATFSITDPGSADFFGAALPTAGLTTLGAALGGGVNIEPGRAAWRGAWRGQFAGV